MKLYIGFNHCKAIKEYQSIHPFGEMITPYHYKHKLYTFFAVDNGAYKAWLDKITFNDKRFIELLEYCAKNELKPDFVVLPDIVCGGVKSLEFSIRWYNVLQHKYKYDYYLAVQDGMTEADVNNACIKVKGIFLGGSNEFKRRESYLWCQYAKKNKLKFHYARCSTVTKLKCCTELNADSVDTTQPLWTYSKMQAFLETAINYIPENKLF